MQNKIVYLQSVILKLLRSKMHQCISFDISSSRNRFLGIICFCFGWFGWNFFCSLTMCCCCCCYGSNANVIQLSKWLRHFHAYKYVCLCQHPNKYCVGLVACIRQSKEQNNTKEKKMKPNVPPTSKPIISNKKNLHRFLRFLQKSYKIYIFLIFIYLYLSCKFIFFLPLQYSFKKSHST